MNEDPCWTADDRARILGEVSDGLWRYVARYAQDVPAASAALANLTGLSPASLDLLRRLHLVLCDEAQVFVERALPDLLRGLRPVAPPRLLAGRGAVRGPIAWGATTAARAREGQDRTLYVAAAAYKHLDTPEARLLLATLHGLAGAGQVLRDEMGDYHAAGWGATAARVERTVQCALCHHHLRDLSASPATAADLAACRRSPRAATRLLARAYTRYRDLVERPTRPALVDALRQRVLVPLDDDTLYELWALLGAAAVLDAEGWTLEAAALAGSHAVPFTYRSADGRATARLRFGHTPASWRRDSRYRALFERYGLAGATRRPDLVVEVRRGRQRRHLLVEVKRTRDPGYIADSIYKALGYLADFAAVFKDQQGPQALLLLWDGLVAGSADSAGNPGGPTGAEGATPPPDSLILATHRDYHARLRSLVSCEL